MKSRLYERNRTLKKEIKRRLDDALFFVDNGMKNRKNLKLSGRLGVMIQYVDDVRIYRLALSALDTKKKNKAFKYRIENVR